MTMTEPTGELQGQVAIVTGGARGIGAAISHALAARGASVGICDIDGDAAGATAAALPGRAPGPDAAPRGAVHTGLALDVSDPDAFDAAAATLAERLGAPTILINNAGITRPGMVHRMTREMWDTVHDVVLRGAFNGVHAVAPWFRDREAGASRRIVNIASVAYHGAVGSANYSAAKAGVVGLTRAIALEWAPFGVTVNAVAPGLIDVGLSRDIPEAMRTEIVGHIPLGRAGTPEDVAAVVAFFCSPAAGFITAQVIDVDGGLPDIPPR